MPLDGCGRRARQNPSASIFKTLSPAHTLVCDCVCCATLVKETVLEMFRLVDLTYKSNKKLKESVFARIFLNFYSFWPFYSPLFFASHIFFTFYELFFISTTQPQPTYRVFCFFVFFTVRVISLNLVFPLPLENSYLLRYTQRRLIMPRRISRSSKRSRQCY